MKKMILALALLFSGVACADGSNPAIVEVTESNFDSLFSSQTPVVVDVYAPWCGPCKNFAKTFEKVQADLGSKYQFVKLDIDALGKKGDPLKISSIPVVIFIKGGKEVGRHAGAMSEETFRKELAAKFGS